VTSPISLFKVTRSGSVEPLGHWLHDERLLELKSRGFPFLGPGSHKVEGELPWVFDDMAPAGFLGARFANVFPELSLPATRNHWSARHVLEAISHRGEDLSGNLLVGDVSRQRFEGEFVPQLRSGVLKRTDFGNVVDEFMAPGAFGNVSSLGGERPKLILHSVGTLDPRDHLLKFTPPLTTEPGLRWKNLLLVESLCAQTLAAQGIAAVGASPETFRVLPGGLRAGLLLPRFDRTGLLGRHGASTLYWLALSRGQFEFDAPAVMRSLADEGLVSRADADRTELVHAFSQAIGNTDAHLGNYGLVFDDEGCARLAPVFDVTAMVLAPMADELPDARITVRKRPMDPRVASWVEHLVRLAREEARLDPSFRDLWFRYLGV
jgi:hypothetical protein